MQPSEYLRAKDYLTSAVNRVEKEPEHAIGDALIGIGYALLAVIEVLSPEVVDVAVDAIHSEYQRLIHSEYQRLEPLVGKRVVVITNPPWSGMLARIERTNDEVLADVVSITTTTVPSTAVVPLLSRESAGTSS